LRGREGFGILSPSCGACEVGFGAFIKIECIFSIASEPELKRRRSQTVFLAEEHSSDVEVDSVEHRTCVRRVLTVMRTSVQCVSAFDGFAPDAGQALFKHLVSSDVSRVASEVSGSVHQTLRRFLWHTIRVSDASDAFSRVSGPL